MCPFHLSNVTAPPSSNSLTMHSRLVQEDRKKEKNIETFQKNVFYFCKISDTLLHQKPPAHPESGFSGGDKQQQTDAATYRLNWPIAGFCLVA